MDKYPFNVYWTLPEAAIPVADVKAKLAASGFNPDEISEPNKRICTSRCVRSFQCRRGGARTIADMAGETEKTAVYALLDRAAGNAIAAVEYNEDTRISYNKETGETTVTGDLEQAFMERLNDQFIGKIQADDLRVWVMQLIDKSCGVPKRPTGGIYIVPGRFRPIFEQAKAFLAGLGTGATLYLERVAQGSEETENMKVSVADYINGRLSEISESVKDYKRQCKLTNLQDTTKQVSDLQALFCEALDIQSVAEDIGDRIQSISDSIGEAMADLAQQQADRKAAKPDVAHASACTPIEVATRVADTLETLENGEADEETVAICLKADNFSGRVSTIYKRVTDAIKGGFLRVAIEEREGKRFYRLADSAAPAAIASVLPPEAPIDEPEAAADLASVLPPEAPIEEAIA